VVLDILFIIWLILIAVQDFKYRAVSWYLFPMGLGILIIQTLHLNHDVNQAWNILLNSCFILFQMLAVTMYFSLKNRRFVNIFKGYFGLGDLFFLLVITAAFSPVNFILFIIFSFALSLFGYLVFLLFIENNRIPLAGLMALILAPVNVITYFAPFDLLSDQWILQWF
jgi:hypothetical protein